LQPLVTLLSRIQAMSLWNMLLSGTSVNWWDATAATGMSAMATTEMTNTIILDRDMECSFARMRHQ
jgi:hypothetical protein